MPRMTRKRSLIGAGVIALLLSAGAYAFWTAGGSGTGTAPTSAGTEALVVNQVTVLNDMYPGDSAQTISGTFDNGNDGPIRVATVTASIASVTGGDGACDATDYTLANAVMTVAANVPVGDGVSAWTGATIMFNNKATNQDGCKGATVNLAYAIA